MTYLDRPVLDLRPDFKEVQAGQFDDHTYESRGIGAATPWKGTLGPKRKVSLPFSFGNRADLDELRGFIRDRHGRRRGFWLPCWLTDYEIAANAALGATEIRIENVRVADGISFAEQFSHLFIASRDTLALHAITDAVADGEEEVLTIDPPLERAISARRFVVGGLLFARLQDDEIGYEFNGHNVCRVNLQFAELPAEYTTEHEGELTVTLYELTRGLAIWRYANFGTSIMAGGETWDAQNISNDELRFGIEFLGDETTLHVATQDAQHPLRFHAESLALGVTTLRIIEIDAEADNTELPTPIYVGRVGQVTFGKEGAIEAECSSSFRVGEIATPRIAIGRRCQHRWGDEFCGINKAAFTTTGTITALGNAYVEATEFGAEATTRTDPKWFVFGLVTRGAEQRFCTGQSGDRLYLNAPFRFAEVGDAISAEAGCDKRINSGCVKFDNAAKHVGFYYTPNQNPQFKGGDVPQATAGKK